MAAGITVDNAPMTTAPGTLTTFLLRAVDPAYDAVLAGTPAALPLTTWFAAAPDRERCRHPGPPDPGRRVDEAARSGARRSRTATCSS